MRHSREQLAEDLIRAGEGDVGAFARVYHATSAKLFGVVVRILGRGDVSEEVLQEVFLKVWQRARDFDRDAASPITWLATIARNRALDERRRRQPSSLDDEPGHLEIASDEDIIGQLLEAEDSRRLRCCLERLEPSQRGVIELIYSDGLTRDEAAVRFGATPSTIRTLIRKSLVELRSCLQNG